jgi:hypothetical protein
MAGNNQEALQAGLRRARALPALLPRQGLLPLLAGHLVQSHLVGLLVDLGALAALLARPSSLRSLRPTRARLI